MNLIVSVRAEDQHLRFDVRGRWEYNDALTLAYQIKAAGARTGVSGRPGLPANAPHRKRAA